ncbi:MAG TPA: SDR family oxidoreductase [Anaerolineales bacterium]|jgi:hypothetical protein
MATKSTGKPRALVTGASSGIGAAFAERLARDGYDLVLVARRRDKLDELAQKLHAEHNVEVEVLVADLSRHDGLRAVEKRIAAHSALEMLVNNAGFGGYMPFVELEPDRAEELINLQVLAVARLTRTALPGMLARGKGAIINVSSRLGFSRSLGSDPLPKRATYAGTKAFINTFTQLLQSELQGTGVQVQALCPGLVATEFHTHVGADPSRFPAAIVMQPEDVVQASLAALKLGEAICVPALEDADLLARIQDAERQFFEASRSGAIATRYKA